ncbi:hypothetical protein SAMN05421823_104281 [Catalinimonas alkaloidigena]|uniref:Uncharacterized protein n=1 Tax=Catalinimonas alkaloidigena TaxID=1075417 RepID=A0A1G9H0S3_9BACT|nr:hypothetical protein [Catalinimonas alkaloidigena]SDL06497.1 hypothetical protein SAMN05421823_104281 [Catalinimonas alkaloidigena]
MKRIAFARDQRLFALRAASFPEGIQAAFEALYARFPAPEARTYVGFSRPNREGTIVYHAAALEARADEPAPAGCEVLVLPKGEYLSATLDDWQLQVETIGAMFLELLQDPRIDPNGACVEWYEGDRVTCLVKLDTAKTQRPFA